MLGLCPGTGVKRFLFDNITALIILASHYTKVAWFCGTSIMEPIKVKQLNTAVKRSQHIKSVFSSLSISNNLGLQRAL